MMRTFIFTLILLIIGGVAHADNAVYNPKQHFSQLQVRWHSYAGYVTGEFRNRPNAIKWAHTSLHNVGFSCPVLEAVDLRSAGDGFILECYNKEDDFNSRTEFTFILDPNTGTYTLYNAHAENWETDQHPVGKMPNG